MSSLLRRTASLFSGGSKKRAGNSHESKVTSKPAPLGTQNPNIESPTLSRLKSKSKLNESVVSLSDFTCPICLEVITEPVQMPCKHELCLPCFEQMTDITNYQCPMCRMRISTWYRNAANAGTLVNKAREQLIQRLFPREVALKQQNKTAEVLAESIEKFNKYGIADDMYKTILTTKSNTAPSVPVCKPGELHNEYVEYMRREEERIRAEKENEERMSIQLIQKLVEEEDQVPFDSYVDMLAKEESSTTNKRESGVQRADLSITAASLRTLRRPTVPQSEGRPTTSRAVVATVSITNQQTPTVAQNPAINRVILTRRASARLNASVHDSSLHTAPATATLRRKARQNADESLVAENNENDSSGYLTLRPRKQPRK